MDTIQKAFTALSLTILLVLGAAFSVQAETEVFPLSPGSSWTYRDLKGNQETLSIRRITQSKGIPLVEASYTGSKPFYYIVGKEGIFRLQPAAGTDNGNMKGDLTLILRWPLEPGQTWESPWSDPPLSFTVLDRGPITVAAGNYYNTVKIGYRPITSPIYQGYIWFEPSVGFLAYEENALRMELVSYSLSDLLPPAPASVGGAGLAKAFIRTHGKAKTGSPGFRSRIKDLALSPFFYMFLLLVFLGLVALVSYFNSRKVEMDLQDQPEVQESELTLASAMVREGLYEDASRILQRLSARHPQWPDIAALLGRAYRETGKLQEACLELKRALTLNPHLAKARLELAKAYLALREPARALEEVETVLADNQGFADAVYLKGEVLVSMGKHQDALVYFREALKINPSFVEAQNALERVLSEED